MTEIGDVIELVTDIPEKGLPAGRQGTIVHVHSNQAYEVEFIDETGETLELLAMYPEQFIVVWRIETGEWVPLADQAAALVANLPDAAGREVVDFARFLFTRMQPVAQGGAVEELPSV